MPATELGMLNEGRIFQLRIICSNSELQPSIFNIYTTCARQTCQVKLCCYVISLRDLRYNFCLCVCLSGHLNSNDTQKMKRDGKRKCFFAKNTSGICSTESSDVSDNFSVNVNNLIPVHFDYV